MITLRDILFCMPYGKDRRQLLLAKLEALESGFAVNRRGSINTKFDLDIEYLLKKNILVLSREYNGSARSRVTICRLSSQS